MSRLNLAFAALADPTRRELLRRIGTGPRRVADLCEGFQMSQPAISKHLRVLREAGLVIHEPRGREHVYHLARRGFADVRAYVDSVSQMWDDALESFVRYTEEKE